MKEACRNCSRCIGRTVRDREVSCGEDGKYSVFRCSITGRHIDEPWRETCPANDKRKK